MTLEKVAFVTVISFPREHEKRTKASEEPLALSERKRLLHRPPRKPKSCTANHTWPITLCEWLTKVAPPSQPMRSMTKTKTNRVSLARVFPRLAPVACICFISDWFTSLFTFIVTYQSNYIGFGFTTLNLKSL